MDAFKKNILEIFGAEAKQWIADLPALAEKFANKYRLTDLQPVTHMNFNYVASGYKNKQLIILKLGFNHQALAKEASCLQAFADHGAAEVLATEPGMIIMQRATPGVMLKQSFPNNDIRAVEILCASIKRLHLAAIPEQHNFYHLVHVLQTLDGDLDIPPEILINTRRMRDELLASTHVNVLLHGDLHHENILRNNSDWLVIDPKGFIGDPVFEVCAFIHNPSPLLLEQANPAEIIKNRIRLCAKLLGFSEQRIHDWLYVKSILGWAWCLEDNMSPAYFSRLSQLLTQQS